ncbi:hypothetical protein DRB89_05985 [Streptomyces sp. ICC4]|nr:hypothetical protein DRB89_05985 [Streptomyces sp. ICC4]
MPSCSTWAAWAKARALASSSVRDWTCASTSQLPRRCVPPYRPGVAALTVRMPRPVALGSGGWTGADSPVAEEVVKGSGPAEATGWRWTSWLSAAGPLVCPSSPEAPQAAASSPRTVKRAARAGA